MRAAVRQDDDELVLRPAGEEVVEDGDDALILGPGRVGVADPMQQVEHGKPPAWLLVVAGGQVDRERLFGGLAAAVAFQSGGMDHERLEAAAGRHRSGHAAVQNKEAGEQRAGEEGTAHGSSPWFRTGRGPNIQDERSRPIVPLYTAGGERRLGDRARCPRPRSVHGPTMRPGSYFEPWSPPPRALDLLWAEGIERPDWLLCLPRPRPRHIGGGERGGRAEGAARVVAVLALVGRLRPRAV